MIWALASGSPLVARSLLLLTKTGVPRLSRIAIGGPYDGHQPGQYTVYPGAGVRKSGLLAMSSKAPVRLNAFKSPRLWNDLVT
jgi:hypothetical protein